MKDALLHRRKPNVLKIVCSFNGKFQQRSPSGKRRYVGGESRIVAVERNIGFSSLKSKVLELHRCNPRDNHSNLMSFSLMYHLSFGKKSAVEDEDSPLVLVTCDDDVTCMIEEYDKFENLGKNPRLWVFVCYNNDTFVKTNVLDNCGHDLSGINFCIGDNGGDSMRKDAVQAVYDNVGGYDEVKKQRVGGSNAVKSSNNDSLRKIVLKQLLLAKQSAKIVGTNTDSRLEIGKFNGNYSYESTEAEILEGEGLGKSASLPASHSNPLNPTNFNVHVKSNGSEQACLTCERGKYKTYCGMNRENIAPKGLDRRALRMGRSSYFGKPGYGIVHGGIRSHRFELRDARNPRAFPCHFRSHTSTGMRYSRFSRSDGRAMVGHVGFRQASDVSRQGQTARQFYLTSWKLPDCGTEKAEAVLARTVDCGLNNQRCSFNLQYGSHENIIELGSPEGSQVRKPESEGCHLVDQSRVHFNATNNSSSCAGILDGQIHLMDDLGNNQHDNQQEVVCDILLQVPTDDETSDDVNKEANLKVQQNDSALPNPGDSNEIGVCNDKLVDTGGGYQSFIQYQNSGHDFSCSVDLSLHNLSLSSFREGKPQFFSSVEADVSDASLQRQFQHPNIMDEEHFSSGPQVENSSGASCVSSSQKMVVDNDEKAENREGCQFIASNDEKAEDKMAHKFTNLKGALPADLAAFYTHLATKELQIINNSDLEYIKELGSGAYGTVFYGKWKGSDVAIKKLKPSRFPEDAADEDRLVADFWKEAHMLGQLHHPNIVALYGVVTDGPFSNFAAVTEYMVNGSLKQVLRRKDRTIDRRKRLIIAMDAAFGMEYLHEKRIVHFDLKSHNFLVNMRDPLRPVCKIGDLGLSKIKQRTLVSGGVRGTIPWMAPELLSKDMVNEKVDVYSFGIVMWELLTGEEPYANMKTKEIIAGIIEGTLRPEIPSWCDPTWRSLMERCWSSDPDARPSFSEIAKELQAMAESMKIK